MTMAEFKNEICDEMLLPLEDRLAQMWPNQKPKITLLIRTPWLPDGGILITNDSLPEAQTELTRLGKKEASR